MSTVETPRPATLPPLVEGQRLDQPTFHERYEAMPDGTRAELIAGVVHMPPMVGFEHAQVNFPVAYWLGCYLKATPGIRGGLNGSTILDARNEVQPDCSIYVLPEYGGQANQDGRMLEGAPELVVEIARASRSIDLGVKREEYRKAGVKDYIVVAIGPDEVFWYVLRGDAYVRLQPGADGLYRSETFPGLWLDPVALYTFDLVRLVAVVELGLASPERAAFLEELARRKHPDWIQATPASSRPASTLSAYRTAGLRESQAQ